MFMGLSTMATNFRVVQKLGCKRTHCNKQLQLLHCNGKVQPAVTFEKNWRGLQVRMRSCKDRDLKRGNYTAKWGSAKVLERVALQVKTLKWCMCIRLHVLQKSAWPRVFSSLEVATFVTKSDDHGRKREMHGWGGYQHQQCFTEQMKSGVL